MKLKDLVLLTLLIAGFVMQFYSVPKADGRTKHLKAYQGGTLK